MDANKPTLNLVKQNLKKNILIINIHLLLNKKNIYRTNALLLRIQTTNAPS